MDEGASPGVLLLLLHSPVLGFTDLDAFTVLCLTQPSLPPREHPATQLLTVFKLFNLQPATFDSRSPQILYLKPSSPDSSTHTQQSSWTTWQRT